MLVDNQTIELTWQHANKKYYQNKGYVFTSYGDSFKVKPEDLSPGSETYVKVVCDFCNKEYNVMWYRYLESVNKKQKNACYDCKNLKVHANTLKRRQENLYNKALKVCEKKGYILLSKQEDIVNNTTYIDYLCPIHGKQSMRINNLISGKGCPDCATDKAKNKYKLSPNEVEKRINECGGILLNKEDYKNQSERNLIIKCPECGTPFVTSLRIFTQHGGQLCDNCSNNVSLGEKRIKYYLEDNKIKFQSQKWFDDCRDIYPLPFDFYLLDYHILIEFDGSQHYKETNYFTYSLETIQKHDAIKTQYCIDNNIKLIRIPYWNINKIEKILDNELILHEDIV